MDSSSPQTGYVYDESTDGNDLLDDGLRINETTYPVAANAKNSWVYGASSISDRLHRASLQTLVGGNFKSSTHAIEYRYNGSNRLVSIGSGLFGGNFFGTNVKLEQFNGSGNYDGFDRFGRPLKQQWKQGSTDIDHFTRSYDHASNLIQRDNVLHANHNRTYGYDDLFRMQSSDESDNSQDRFWGLDQLGNQRSIFHNNDGSGAANSTRTYSAANELETLSNGANPDPHDEAGNMTKMPSPSALNLGLTAKYDAWNRLVDLSNVNASFQYDGLHRRIKRTEGSATVHFYYNEKWQVLTETDGTNATAIYNYHPHYVDAVAVRMRSASASGVTGGDEHFFTCDHQHSITAAVDRATKAVVERYRYTPLGARTVLNANFGAVGGNQSSLGVEYAYTGRRLDASGLQLHRYRYYHPVLGRWINRDPTGYVDGMNLYGAYFVPRALDPMGLQIPSIAYPPGNNPHDHAADGLDNIKDNIIDNQNVSDAEKCWCKKNPICCFDASNSKDRIVQAMKDRYGTSTGNASVFNAIQHCAWMCEVSNNISCSKEQAIGLGEAHEEGSSNGPLNDGMDLFNNGVGASLSSLTTNGCISECEKKAREHGLYWYDPIDTPAYPTNPDSKPPKPTSDLPTDFPDFTVDENGKPSGEIGGSSPSPVVPSK